MNLRMPFTLVSKLRNHVTPSFPVCARGRGRTLFAIILPLVLISAISPNVSIEKNISNPVSLIGQTGISDFNITALPYSLHIYPNFMGTSNIYLGSLNGFTGTITLSISSSPGLTASIDRANLSLGPNGSNRTFLAAGSAVPGYYSVTVTGSQGSLSHSVVMTVNVNSVPAGRIGLVCITASNSTLCPSTAPILRGTVRTNFTVALNIQGSDSINAFDISVKTDPTILKPASIDFTGSVLPGPPGFVDECINGVLVQGPRCGSTDGPGVAHLALGACLACITIAPTGGLLFRITYQVLSPLNTTINYQTECWSSSVSGTTDCLTLANGTTWIVPVRSQPALFIDPPRPEVSVTLSESVLFDGLRVSLSGSLKFDFTLGTIYGYVFVQAVNSTTGTTVFSKNFTISISLGSSSMARFVLLVPATTIEHADSCLADSAAPIARCYFSRNPDVAHRGVVDIVDFGILAHNFGSVRGTPGYNPALDLAARGMVDIVDIGIAAIDYGVPIFT